MTRPPVPNHTPHSTTFSPIRPRHCAYSDKRSAGPEGQRCDIQGAGGGHWVCQPNVLTTKARSEGRLSVGPNPSRPQEVPIRLEQCPLDFHEAHEANCLNIMSTRDTNDYLCAPDCRQCSGNQNTLEGSTRDPSGTGIRYQHEEECILTNPEVGLPGVCHRRPGDGNNTSSPETPLPAVTSKEYLELKAAFLALRTFLPRQGPLTVLHRMDNVMAIAFLNRMGGTHSLPLSVRGDMGVVHTKEIHYPCGTPPRGEEHKSRLAVMPPDGLE